MSRPELQQHRTSADRILLGLVQALRAAGVSVPMDRSRQFLAAAALLGVTRSGVRQAAAASLCRSPADLAILYRVLELYFRDDLRLEAAPEPSTPAEGSPLLTDDSVDDNGAADPVPALSSDREVLSHRDFATLSPQERARLESLFAGLRVRLPRRSSARRTPERRGAVDAARTARAVIRQLGEPATISYRDRAPRDRRVVFLVDVSGSMSSYAVATLRLAHAVTRQAPGLVDTFVLGTRVTRVTDHLRRSSADAALEAIARDAPDWSGGTRLGDGLESFLATWGRPRLARGAVVAVFSDGWEPHDTHHLALQVRRLRLLAHKVFWVNPHRGKPGYEPVQKGILAVLPHVDTHLAGHSLATFTDLLDEIARA